MKRLHLVKSHELSSPTVYEPARFRTEVAELHSSLDALKPPGVRHALLSRAVHRARLRMAERDEMDRGRTGSYLRNENLTGSFNGGLLLRPMLECPLDLIKTVAARQLGRWQVAVRAALAGEPREQAVHRLLGRMQSRDVFRGAGTAGAAKVHGQRKGWVRCAHLRPHAQASEGIRSLPGAGAA